MRNKKYTNVMKWILSQVGWAKKLDDASMQSKAQYDLNRYAHPSVSRKWLELAAESISKKGMPCPEGTPGTVL